jgi:hypothetical protein
LPAQPLKPPLPAATRQPSLPRLSTSRIPKLEEKQKLVSASPAVVDEAAFCGPAGEFVLATEVSDLLSRNKNGPPA